MNVFEEAVNSVSKGGLFSQDLEILQVNLGFRCNQTCTHCHLGASPLRTELMKWETMQSILNILQDLGSPTVDLTGGAPELNPNFRKFVAALRELAARVQVRTNLTVLLEPGMTDLPEFLRFHDIHLVASMPCYLEENVTAQRGTGVYYKSIKAIRRLNSLGYGFEGGLPLNLVYNPSGPFYLPTNLSSRQHTNESSPPDSGYISRHSLPLPTYLLADFIQYCANPARPLNTASSCVKASILKPCLPLCAVINSV